MSLGHAERRICRALHFSRSSVIQSCPPVCRHPKALMRFLPLTQMVALMDRIMAEKINRALNFIDAACENFSHDFPQCCPFSDKKLDRHFCDFWNSVANRL